MRLMVLGRWSPYPPAGGACPGYLIEADGARILIDCGTGVLANLQRFCTVFDLAGIVVTHLHPDHVLDLFMVKQALQFGRPQHEPPPLPLFAPPGAIGRVTTWMDESSAHAFTDRFAFHPIDVEAPVHLGPFALRFASTQHSLPCFAVRCEAGGRTLAYSADTGPAESVEALAGGADVFLCESTLRVADEVHAPRVGHLSGRLAGLTAARADADRLLLTHFFAPYGDYAEEARAEAAKEFPREVDTAIELATYDI